MVERHALDAGVEGQVDPAPVERRRVALGDDADVDYMQAAIGLIWRALVMWMLLISVVTLAHSTG